MKKPLPAETILGNFQLGARNVQVRLAWAEYGGHFASAPDVGELPRITIGMANTKRAWSVVMHEALELAMTWMGLRFVADYEEAHNSAAYWFHMDHQQFAECVAQAGYFMRELMPKIQAAQRERHRLETAKPAVKRKPRRK